MGSDTGPPTYWTHGSVAEHRVLAGPDNQQHEKDPVLREVLTLSL
jgi:hypothetical protein